MTHLVNGEFQSDKYPTTPRGKVPLSCKDKTAQDLLWEYAQRRRAVDAEFAADLESALRNAGYEPARAWHPTHRHFKGGEYRLLFFAVDSETGYTMAVYENSQQVRFVRPSSMFNEQLMDGRRRFAPL